MGRTASARNLVLSTNPRYTFELATADAARVQARRRKGSGDFATTLAITVGLLNVICVAVAASSSTLVDGNDLARTAIERNGPSIIASYRWTTLVVGLMLVALGIRSAVASARDAATLPTSQAYVRAALAGLNAAGIALLAWWTAWIFV